MDEERIARGLAQDMAEGLAAAVATNARLIHRYDGGGLRATDPPCAGCGQLTPSRCSACGQAVCEDCAPWCGREPASKRAAAAIMSLSDGEARMALAYVANTNPAAFDAAIEAVEDATAVSECDGFHEPGQCPSGACDDYR